MRYHSQNLSERKGVPFRSKFWHGRAWLHNHFKDIHLEWELGWRVRSLNATITFGNGDDDAGVLFALAIPFLFSVYFGVAGIYRCRESEVGIAVHNNAIWLYTFSDRNESRREWPWWKSVHSWYFPWEWTWYSTEILEHKCPAAAKAVFTEKQGDLKRLGIDSFEMMRQSDVFKKSVTETYDYTYVRNNGEIQKRQADVYVDRMTWRMRWHWILPFKKVRDSININFNEEVGEGTGSWKGGCTGCGYDIAPHETPLEALRRMEWNRRFER